MLLAGCSPDCALFHVLRAELIPAGAPVAGASRLWQSGAGGEKWPSGQDPPAGLDLLAGALLRGEGSGGLRLSLVLGAERLLLLELPVRTATGAALRVTGPVDSVEFTGGYGEGFGWWDTAWRHFPEARPVRASVIDPFTQVLSAASSSGAVSVLARAPLALAVDVESPQRSGPSERAVGRVDFRLEEGREICSSP